jgi:hypothetical protein
VRRQIASGAAESSFEYHDSYPLTLLEALQPYDLESMTLIPAQDAPATTDNPHVGITAVTGRDTHILFVVNTDMAKPQEAQVRCNRPNLEIDLARHYRIVELTTGSDRGIALGSELVDDGLSLQVPENSCALLALSGQ